MITYPLVMDNMGNMAMENGPFIYIYIYRQLIRAQHYNSLTQLCNSYFF